MKQSVKCMTKKDKGGTAIATNIVYDFEGVTVDDLIPGWLNYATIRMQSKWRNGEGAIPTAVEVRVKDMAKGRQAEVVTPETVFANAATLTAEQRAALIERLKSGK